ncbi:MAG: proton-conducting transporter membrane subunit, partial [Pseudomonadota bacterium]
MFDLPILTLLLVLPLVGAGFILFIRGEAEIVADNVRSVALWTSGIEFLLSLFLWLGFDTDNAGFQFVERAEWMPGLDIAYHVGVDGISVLFVLLTTLLTPICVLASWESIRDRVREYMVAFLVMETMMVGMFASLDLFLFYVFFESVLIPMFLIIGVWGGPKRVYAAFKFFLYTLTGSVLMLVALLAIYIDAGTSDIPRLLA